MAFNGAGSYSLPAGNPVVTGTTISSTTHNNTMNDIATALSTVICKDGQTTVTANIPMAGFKLTGLAAGSANGDSVRYEQAGLVANPLSQFAATTSAQLAGVISDETGSGALVFATSPTLVTPALGTPASGDLRNCSMAVAPAIGGTTPAAVASTALSYSTTLSGAAGTVGNPSLYLGGDTTSGLYRIGANNLGLAISGAKVLDISSTTYGVTGNETVSGTGKFGTTVGVGNATPSASGAGITFPATQSASTDPNTLDDYEEGTWTPSQGAGLTVVGAFSSSGYYTKKGREVTLHGYVAGATSVAVNATGIICGNGPFSAPAVIPYSVGGMTNSTFSASGLAVAYSTQVYAATNMAATPSISFTVVFQI